MAGGNKGTGKGNLYQKKQIYLENMARHFKIHGATYIDIAASAYGMGLFISGINESAMESGTGLGLVAYSLNNCLSRHANKCKIKRLEKYAEEIIPLKKTNDELKGEIAANKTYTEGLETSIVKKNSAIARLEKLVKKK